MPFSPTSYALLPQNNLEKSSPKICQKIVKSCNFKNGGKVIFYIKSVEALKADETLSSNMQLRAKLKKTEAQIFRYAPTHKLADNLEKKP